VTQLRQRHPPLRCPEHLAWIRHQPCCVDGCSGRAVPHHVRTGSSGGMGMKPSDDKTVPLCAAHHAEFHRLGVHTFEDMYDVDLRQIAARFAAASPYLPTE
jgi:hypothetical protein